MYQRALESTEKALGPDHTSTLQTVNDLGILYSYQGRLKDTEEMYQRALEGTEKALGPDHTSTLYSPQLRPPLLSSRQAKGCGGDVPACIRRQREGIRTRLYVDSLYSPQLRPPLLSSRQAKGCGGDVPACIERHREGTRTRSYVDSPDSQ